MADKKGTGATIREIEVKRAVANGVASKEAEVKKVVPNGPTSKQAFRKVEEEQRARLAKQRKAEEEWLLKLIQKEDNRRKRIQKALTKEEEEDQKTAQRACATSRSADDSRRNLFKNLEEDQRDMHAGQISTQTKPVKAVQITGSTLDRITEETESASSRRQD
ncbi:uncharacterized protein [Physcomitrium patens]|uniref:Uncharacterized protein n=1 Tax=Physcomitrium patens TaxID=3218 RepID=A0A2K1KEE0_PHYPA|nr:uncharacterized protein LOC112284053 [Physcomitrium patens]XP_024379328.1 uncharacterized protein LOC112284053 [Physcomitrium patens]XP_024379329.1 uncharacterized protein LOC112284053 [Physcomitrium patens]PNR52143.1 hypothetical protein PHYPA_008517 [Physcomitrium patens]|eukprot:XP_024379327.1 uncharacterized protein LOC112284053 [Physcomitrella patens]